MTAAAACAAIPACRGGVRPAPREARVPDLRATIPGWSFSIPARARRSRRAVIDGVAEFYRTDYANVHRGVYRLSARSTELFEEAREKVRALSQRRRRARDRLRARRHRGDQPRRAELGRRPSSKPATRCSSASSSTTPTSCRGRCCATASASSWSWRRSTRPAGSTSRAFEALLIAAHQARRGDASRQCDRRAGAGRDASSRLAHAQGRQGAGRRLPGGAAAAGRCAGARLRFLCLLRPQDLWADRHRRALRPLRAARRRCRPGRAAAT